MSVLDERRVPAGVRALVTSGPALAAFDADGCLWSGDVAEDFTRWMIARGDVQGALWREYEAVNARDPIAACYVLLRFFAGMPYDVLVRAAQTFWQDAGERPWNVEVIDTLRFLKKRGHTIFVVSGSPAFVLEPLSARLPVDKILAFELALDHGGRATGAHRGVATAGPGKAEAIRAAWPHPVSFAIGNSVLDTEMLALARFAWAYEPSAALLARAHERGWHTTPRR